MTETIIGFLANPASHVLTFVLGASLYHIFIAQPERKRNEKVQEHVDELFDLQKAALQRIGHYELPARGRPSTPDSGASGGVG